MLDSLALVLMDDSPVSLCGSAAWRSAVVALEAADQALIDVWQGAHQTGDDMAGEVARAHLQDQREVANSFILSTASYACIRSLLQDHRDDNLAYSMIVRHAFPGPSNGLEVIERELEWNERLFQDGAIQAVTYGGLIDRYELGVNGRQLYGSHLGCVNGVREFEPEIHQPDQLTARRAAIGWPGEQTDAMLGEPCGAATED
ncbi:MAG: hypothetical protein RIA71_13090 [Oceanicaulis sp.]